MRRIFTSVLLVLAMVGSTHAALRGAPPADPSEEEVPATAHYRAYTVLASGDKASKGTPIGTGWGFGDSRVIKQVGEAAGKAQGDYEDIDVPRKLTENRRRPWATEPQLMMAFGGEMRPRRPEKAAEWDEDDIDMPRRLVSRRPQKAAEWDEDDIDMPRRHLSREPQSVTEAEKMSFMMGGGGGRGAAAAESDDEGIDMPQRR